MERRRGQLKRSQSYLILEEEEGPVRVLPLDIERLKLQPGDEVEGLAFIYKQPPADFAGYLFPGTVFRVAVERGAGRCS